MKKGSIILIILAIISMSIVPVLSFFIAPQLGPEEMSYFNLSVGSEWYYESSDNETSWQTKRYIPDDFEFVHGIFGTFCIYWCQAVKYEGEENYMWLDQMWISKRDNQLVWWGYEDADARIIVDNGLTYVTEPVQEGVSHYGKSKGTLTLKSSQEKIRVDFEGNYTIEKIETLTVPAGTFENCIRVHEQEITPDGVADFYVWYAPEVGAIKYWFLDGNQTDVLTHYSIDPNDDPWKYWPMPYVPVMLEWTIIGLTIGITVITITLVIDKKSNNR
ncbi:MAG: hypothetical protein BAJALOKI2v1_750017 [Promethearchaeota archaeon]|nr:MAG: hypothetical protein BAJALOKI2v1_750017 [Candidatus Lokiarchaeota archaeon]